MPRALSRTGKHARADDGPRGAGLSPAVHGGGGGGGPRGGGGPGGGGGVIASLCEDRSRTVALVVIELSNASIVEVHSFVDTNSYSEVRRGAAANASPNKQTEQRRHLVSTGRG